jgi:hypothetical protein
MQAFPLLFAFLLLLLKKKMTRTYQTLQSLLCPCCFEEIGAVPEVIDVNSASRRLPLFSAHRIVFLAFEGLS